MPAQNIYDIHAKAFASVSAYIVVKDGEKVASVAFKYPRDGASRLWTYVHWLGVPMVRGYAGGYGYDKHSAAVANAIPRIDINSPRVTNLPDAKTFVETLREGHCGNYWYDRLRKAGFEVWQAV